MRAPGLRRAIAALPTAISSDRSTSNGYVGPLPDLLQLQDDAGGTLRLTEAEISELLDFVYGVEVDGDAVATIKAVEKEALQLLLRSRPSRHEATNNLESDGGLSLGSATTSSAADSRNLEARLERLRMVGAFVPARAEAEQQEAPLSYWSKRAQGLAKWRDVTAMTREAATHQGGAALIAEKGRVGNVIRYPMPSSATVRRLLQPERDCFGGALADQAALPKHERAMEGQLLKWPSLDF